MLRFWIPVGLLTAVHIPLVAIGLAGLSHTSHYSFWPLVLLGVGGICYLRLRRMGPLEPSGGIFHVAGALGIVGLLTLAVLCYEPRLGYISLLLWLLLVAHWAGGWPLLGRILTPWALLWILIRPPFMLDIRLMAWLQLLASRWSSLVLDAIGIVHRHTGNLIRVPNVEQAFGVEEACSGINGLMAITAGICLYVLWQRRGWISSGILLLSGCFWTLTVNMLRVVLIVWSETQLDVSLTEGVAHEAVGVVVFTLALALTLSTERLLGAIAPDFWARSQASPLPDEGPTQLATHPPSWPVAALLIGLSAAVGLLEAAMLIARPQIKDDKALVVELNATGKEVLSAELGAWRQVAHKDTARDRNSIYGEFSQEFRYVATDARALATVSFDYPFHGWHDLEVCYRGSGWRIDKRLSHPLHPLEQRPAIVELQMSQPTGQFGTTFFMLFHGVDRPIYAGEVAVGRHMRLRVDQLRHSINLLRGDKSQVVPSTTSYQLQVFFQRRTRLNDAERQRLLELLRTAYADIMTRWPGR